VTGNSIQLIPILIPISFCSQERPGKIIKIPLPAAVIHPVSMKEEMCGIYLGRLPVGIENIKGLFFLCPGSNSQQQQEDQGYFFHPVKIVNPYLYYN